MEIIDTPEQQSHSPSKSMLIRSCWNALSVLLLLRKRRRDRRLTRGVGTSPLDATAVAPFVHDPHGRRNFSGSSSNMGPDGFYQASRLFGAPTAKSSRCRADELIDAHRKYPRAARARWRRVLLGEWD
jgi:hypothetical protein